MQRVVETPIFLRQAAKLFDQDQKQAVVDFLANNPGAGDLIPGASGVRKVRIPASGRGKRGGTRVIYYYHDASIPLFALLVYAKNQQEDLSPDGLRTVAALAESIKVNARRRP